MGLENKTVFHVFTFHEKQRDIVFTRSSVTFFEALRLKYYLV